MARLGLFPCWLAGVIALGPLAVVRAGDERDSAIAATLAVQTAMQQGREHLLRNDPKAAVYVLESQLTRINGSTAYLALLRDAYRAYIQELRLANQPAAVQLYMQRLQILDPGAALDLAASVPKASPAPAAPKAPGPAPEKVAGPVPGKPTIRATMEEPADASPPDKIKPTLTLLARAEEEFSNRHFKEAGLLFEEVSKTDPGSLMASRERWAYCKLFRVVEQINQPPTGGLPWADLEKDVRHAMELAPRLDYARYLLDEIQRRRKPAAGDKEAAVPAVSIQHGERGADGWTQAESANFRIYHNQPRDLVETVAQAAERARLTMHQKWFGGQPEAWSPRCDIYLHATAADYVKATGIPGHSESPGHSTIKTENGRVVGRRIDLRCDEPAMVAAILPHETTHVVLAGQFGTQAVPRWADEGVAVLTEPRDRVERHLRNLPRLRQENQLLHVSQLLQLNDYPRREQITVFYAQSVSVVEFLAEQKGPQVFSQFLREALRDGYEPALQKHYGFRGYDDLQQAWMQRTFDAAATPGGLARTRP